MPFGEALQQIPLYAKFLKDTLTRKNRYIHSDIIVVEGNCSVVIQHILPRKHSDPGSVTIPCSIPCSISEVAVDKTLIDLGANINLMPLSMCRRLGELEIMSTRMTLQLADHFITRPYGVIEDVLVRVKHLIIPANFGVVDIEEDANIPVILGCPFMSTASCVVDMGKKKLEMSLENQKISFDLFNEGRELLDQDVCLQVKELDKKMASRKRKAPASTSQACYDRFRFTSQEAWDCYSDIVIGRKILLERNVMIYHAEFDEFKYELERKNWHKELTNFMDGSIDVAIVKDFYAYLYDPEDKSPKQVRGHLIKFDEDTLNTFLKTPMLDLNEHAEDHS
ncbi:uncharacterized protein LOC114405006 [Glycine soja]|uniref:uncharacterized protein LOC114405006 n=1 Tax=Glycine soja TaxID=3848 RepID=UPI00103DFE50|nr:uncharacterized protein LOC114405006 [Glycine soja]